MGTWGIGVMNSTAFSLLAYSNPEIDGNQEMELTIGKPELLRRIFGFDSPFRSGKTGVMGMTSRVGQGQS
jgi:hypothetical protein